MNKSPFLVYQHFISPHHCESLAPLMELESPPMNDSTVLSHITEEIDYQEDVEELLFDVIQQSSIISDIEKHYGVTVKDYGKFIYHWYPMDFEGEKKPYSDAFTYYDSKWYKVKDRDFTAVLFLNEFNDESPLDPRFEVFGGKLQMVNWNFSFNPQRGTLLVFPSCPRFLQAVSSTQLGESHMIKFFIRTSEPYVIDMADFSGDPTTWFEDL